MINRNAVSRFPISWISTLYMAEGLPYFAVNVLAVILYTRMGVGLKEMAFFTGWLYLPWVIKPFWSSFVDIFSTKRRWILTMQFLITLTFAAVAFLLPLPFFFASSLAVFWVMAFFSATHDIAADGFYMLALTDHQQAAYSGWRNTFYRIGSLIGQGGLVYMAGKLEESYSDVTRAWATTFLIMSLFFLLIFLYHTQVLPKPAEDRNMTRRSAGEIWKEFGATFATFFTKRHIFTALLFMLFYRFGEALMLKVSAPFMLEPVSEGGLGLTTADLGIINGTVGVIALLAGGIIGGLCISIGGLKKWLWPMALSLTLPCGIYCWLAMTQPSSLIAINIGIGIEQFGYGFGFTAFMLYLIYFCEGPFKTSHYAFCTAFMALGMMLPGMAAGWVFEQVSTLQIFHSATPGYVNYFWLVMLCSVTTYIVCALVKIDPEFGKSKKSGLQSDGTAD